MIRTLSLAAALLAGIAVISTVGAQQFPPNRFFGSLTIGGQPAPVGTTVQAFIEGTECASITTMASGQYVIDVPGVTINPNCGRSGQSTITFRVNGQDAGTATYRDGGFVQLNLTAGAGAPFTAAQINLDAPCIPPPGERQCDANRLALWNGEAQAWAAHGVTDPDARFNETVVFRVREGDPAAIRNIARILGWPYLQITRLHFGGPGQGEADEFVEVTNLGGGDQDLTGWTLRSPARNAVFRLPASVTLRPGQTCRLFTGRPLTNPGGECRAFTAIDQVGPGGRVLIADVWPDDAGEAILFFEQLNLPGDETRYDAGPASQPPPPNLQGTVIGMEQPPQSAFELVLSTAETAYATGEQVSFEMVLRNHSGQQQTLTFPSGQDFDVVVSSADGREVWRWSTGRFFTQAVREVTLAPGEERRFNVTWDQRTDAGTVVPAGPYRATATLATQPPLNSDGVEFRIQ